MFKNLINRSLPKVAFKSLYSIRADLFNSGRNVKIIKSHSTSIFWNLASEEYLFESPDLDCPTLFLYREDKTIIIGRHQNPWKECFLQEMKKDEVSLCRRKSGGGAVYQDLGNTCFSFLTPMEKDSNPDLVKERDNKILLTALKKLGINAQASGRNDISVGDKKISGSAFKLNLGKKDGSGRKYLHHGTMLIDVNLDVLQKYLNVNKKKLQSKGIDSVRARVENMKNINPDITHEALCEAIVVEFVNAYEGFSHSVQEYTEQDLMKIQKIKDIHQEITSWDWLYQKTPEFTNEMETRFDWGIVDLMVQVKDGVIIDGKVYSDCLFPDFIDKLNELIKSKTVNYDFPGMEKLFQQLRETYAGNETYLKFIKDLEGWLPNAL